jgi:cell division protease FtsH
VKEVTIQGSDIKGTLAEGKSFTTYAPEDPRLVERLTEKNVSITAKPRTNLLYLSALIYVDSHAAPHRVWILFMRQMQSGGTKAMSFGRSKAGS